MGFQTNDKAYWQMNKNWWRGEARLHNNDTIKVCLIVRSDHWRIVIWQCLMIRPAGRCGNCHPHLIPLYKLANIPIKLSSHNNQHVLCLVLWGHWGPPATPSPHLSRQRYSGVEKYEVWRFYLIGSKVKLTLIERDREIERYIFIRLQKFPLQ